MSVPKRLLNKVAIVTGASSGIGRAICLRYAQEGANIVCADINHSARSEITAETTIETDRLIQQRKGRAIFVKTEVGSAIEMEALIQGAVVEFGRLDIMVNNAGVSLESRYPAMVHEAKEEIWDTTLRVNAKSTFLGCKYATGQMLRQDPHPSGDRGWIINMSSIMGIVAGTVAPAYCALKGAVSNLTRQVALDYAKHRIRCNAICPGYTQTAIFTETTSNMDSREVLDAKHPLGGCGQADDIAKMAVVLASDDAAWMTGTLVPVDGGFTAQ